jgi:hypothetical protein
VVRIVEPLGPGFAPQIGKSKCFPKKEVKISGSFLKTMIPALEFKCNRLHFFSNENKILKTRMRRHASSIKL